MKRLLLIFTLVLGTPVFSQTVVGSSVVDGVLVDLFDNGTWREQHPTINGIKAMMDLIREVEQAAQAPIATPDDITAGAKTPEVAAVVELRKQLAVLKALKDCLAS